MKSILSKIQIFLRNAWLLFGITLIMILVIEIGARVILHFKPKAPLEPANVNPFIHEFNDEIASIRPVWHPYETWRWAPLKLNFIHLNQDGIRVTVNQKMSGHKTKIFMFGGSTLWGFPARDAFTIPSYLSQLLNQNGFRVEITNFGQPYYASTQELISFLLEIQRQNVPDIVIFYDGVNEVLTTRNNGVAGWPEHERDREKEFNLLQNWRKRELAADFFKSLASSSAALSLFSRQTFSPNGSEKKHIEGVNQLSKDILDVYVTNVETVEGICQKKRCIPVFYWQPTILSKKKISGSELDALAETKWFKELSLAAYRRIEMSQTLHAKSNFHDISHLLDLVPDPIFYDYCHVTEATNKLIANRIFKDVKTLIK